VDRHLRRPSHLALLYPAGSASLAARIDQGFVANMLVVLTLGLLLWVGYGLLKTDWVIVAANSVGALLSASVLVFKFRDMRSRK
jgi:Sugar efflux transporter for intercellular exchange